jgi:hypothetical protein
LGIGTTGQVLTVAGGVPSWATPAGGGGKVLQVINATYATSTSNTTGTTLLDTGLTASITPSSASSKVLVIVHQAGVSKYNANIGVELRLLRGATSLAKFEGVSAYNNVGAGSDTVCAAGINYLDSPATTSSTTYKTQFARSSADGEALVQRASATSSITLMEIGA